MCSNSHAQTVEKETNQLEQSQQQTAQTLNAEYQTMLGQNQQLVQQMAAKLNYIAANPMGLTQPQMAGETTAINENTAKAAQQAAGAAGAYAAAHGAADVGSGAAGETAGQIYSGAAQSKAQQLAALSRQNEATKQQNFWNSISGLNSVGRLGADIAGTTLSGANAAANSAVNAGDLSLKAGQAARQNIGSEISGIAGLAESFVPGLSSVGKMLNIGGGGSSAVPMGGEAASMASGGIV